MPKENLIQTHRFIFDDFDFEDFSEQQILKHLKSHLNSDNNLKVHPLSIHINQASFEIEGNSNLNPIVAIVRGEKQLLLSCDCGFAYPERFLCDYQSTALSAISKKPEYRIFFDEKQRNEIFKTEAVAYGLENEDNLSDYFELVFERNSYSVKAKNPKLIPLNSSAFKLIKNTFVPSLF